MPELSSPAVTEALDLLEKITPGEWIADMKPAYGPKAPARCLGIHPKEHNHPATDDCYDHDDCPVRTEIVTTDSGYYGPVGFDAEFIAAAPRLLRALVNENQMYVDELDALRTSSSASAETGEQE